MALVSVIRQKQTSVARATSARLTKRRATSITGGSSIVKKARAKPTKLTLADGVKVTVKKSRLVKTVKKVEEVKKVEKTLELGHSSYVLIKGQNTIWGENTYSIAMRDNGIPGKVLRFHQGQKPDDSVLVEVQACFGFSRFQVYIQKDAVKVISETEYKAILAELPEKYKKMLEEGLKALNEKIKAKRLPPLQRRDYDSKTKTFLDTNMNFIALGNLNQAGEYAHNTFTRHCQARCCAIVKTTSDVTVWIPKMWLNYYGYHLKDLELWLAFLRDLGIGFNGRYTREVNMREMYPGAYNVKVSQPAFANNNYYLPENPEAYEVVIPRGSSAQMTYMYFILVRYMYNTAYWTIPMVALQIKDGLKNRATHWESLILAHCNEVYSGYYALCQNNDNTGESSRVCIPTRAFTIDRILAKLEGANSSVSMNLSHEYISVDGLRKRIESDIRKQRWDSLAAILDEHR